MALFASFLGQRVEVKFFAGGRSVPATGKLVADSGRCVFLEEDFHQPTGVKRFRWEIPYDCIVGIEFEALAAVGPAAD